MQQVSSVGWGGRGIAVEEDDKRLFHLATRPGPNGETGDICKHSVTLFFYSRAYTESYQVRGVRGALKLEVFVGRQLERAPKLIIEPSPCQGSMRSNP